MNEVAPISLTPRVPRTLLILACCTQSWVAAAAAQRIDLTAVPFSIRSAGLAGASVSVMGDAGSVFSNPTGLAIIRNAALEGRYGRLAPGVEDVGAAAAITLGQFNFGFGAQVLEEDPTPASPRLTSRVWALSAVYRFGMFAVGATGKYVSVPDSAGREVASTVADFGGTLAFFDIMALSLSVQNTLPSVRDRGGVELPVRTRLGFTFNFVDPQSTGRLMGTVEVVWSDSEARRTIVGAEAGLVFHGVGLVGRIGYGAQSLSAPGAKTSYGASLVLWQVELDYAFQADGGFGDDIHRLGLRWAL